MGRGKSVLASMLGFRSGGGERRQEQEMAAAAGVRRQQQQQRCSNYYQGRTRRVRPSDDDDDDYYGQHWYAERDIDRRASEFIDRVHRRMITGSEQEGS